MSRLSQMFGDLKSVARKRLLAFFPIKMQLNGPAIAVVPVLVLLASCGGGGGGPASQPAPDPIPLGNLSISGVISVSASVTVDLDTNDPNAPLNAAQDNDLPYDFPPAEQKNIEFNGQLLPNPGTAGGFVAMAGMGPAGPATNDADWNDFYRVSLLPGQTISLLIADHIENNPARNDLDLLLLDLDLQIIDTAAGLGPLETLTIAEAGEYFVWVTVCADTLTSPADRLFICGDGASNYTLSVGQAEAEATTSGLRLSSDFVSGEALVRYKEVPPLAETGDATAYFSATASSLGEAPQQVGNISLLKFESAPVLAAQASVLPDEIAAVVAETQQSWITVSPEQRAKLRTLAKIKELAGQENIALAEPNYMRQALFEPDDPGYQYQWHYPLINLSTAWDLGFLGSNVTVAVLDTGILPFHPDMQGQIDFVSGGYDFVSDIRNARDDDGEDDDPTDPGDSNLFGFSSSFHGTHVAGTIAAATNNGIGVAGVAPDARLLPVRVLGQDGGTSFDIRRGLCFAAGLSTGPSCDGVPVNRRPADVINLSLGGTDPSLIEAELIDELLAAGSIIVAAAGNNASSQPFYPAAYDGVIAVSAVTINQTRAPYSSFGSYVDVAAPGGDTSRNIDGDPYADGVLSTGGNDAQGPVDYNYPFFQGTSMAAPHVAGVFALMRSANADLDPEAVTAMLERGELTIPLGDVSNGGRNDTFGYGLIDANRAVAAAIAADGSPPEPRPWLGAFPNALNFGATLESLRITLRNNSGGDLDLVSISSSESWLTAPAADGLTEYDLQVDRDGLAEGSYSAVLTIASDVNVVNVPVIMQIIDTNLTGDAGHMYVRLIDLETGNIREVETDVIDGEYVWQIDQLPATGENAKGYRVVAHTNADNDNQLCDPGEACGSYLTVDQPIAINLQENLINLDFQINFGSSLSDADNPDK
jgi:serine protease